MKKTFFTVLAAFAILSFASCRKETPASDNQKPVLRTVTAVFENSGTKTTLDSDGHTPLWSVGDTIRLLNHNDSYGKRDIIIKDENIDNNKLTFTTDLTGDIYAIYPASATQMWYYRSGYDFIINIPSVQDGSFGSANICVAKGTGDDKNVNLIFSNVASVLEFSQTAATTGVKKVQVRAANAIAGPLIISFGTDNKVNSVTTTQSTTTKTIIANASKALDKFYVAVAPVTTGKIEFKYSKDPLNVASYTDATGKTLTRNKIYGGASLSMNDKTYGRDYVTIAAKYDGTNVTELKWSTENLAITSSGKREFRNSGHINGDYFQWGAYAGYCGQDTDSDKGLLLYNSFTSNACGDNTNVVDYKSSGESHYVFDAFHPSENCINIAPYSSGPNSWTYTKYSNDDKMTLDATDDVASIILGGNWRMPTAQEFEAMKAVTYLLYADEGLYVFAPNPEEDAGKFGNIYHYALVDALLFFPGAGHITGAGLVDNAPPSSYGHYYSNTLHEYKLNAEYLNFYSSFTSVNPAFRDIGCSVRPVSN